MGNKLRKLKSRKAEDNNKNRDSYSYRICDDLCEDILQYLTLEDKLRLQCVAKQFQRTIFQRQYELGIGYTNFDLFKKMTVNSFKSMLNKCPNINYIYIPGYYQVLGHRLKISHNDWVNLVKSNCHYVTKIKLDSSITEVGILEKVTHKFSHSIKVFNCDQVKDSSILKCLKNIEELNVRVCNFEDVKNDKFCKMKKLTVYMTDDNWKNLLTFIHNNPGIQSINITLYINDRDLSSSLLLELSKMTNITHFRFTQFPLNSEQFKEGLTQMALNCTKLKSIICKIHTNADNYHKLNELLSPLKKFKELKRLSMKLMGDISLEKVACSNQMIENLTGLKNLTDLTIRIHNYNNDLANIALINFLENMPLLRKLFILSKIDYYDNLLDLICSIKQLETIKLCISDNQTKSIIEKKVLDNCAKIKVIDIERIN